MVCILHLHPAQCDLQTQLCVDQLLGDLGDGFAATALRVGMGGELHHLPGAVVALRGIRRTANPVVHAWGPIELAAAALAGFRRIVFTPPAVVSGRWFRWLIPMLHHCHAEIVCPTATLKRVFVEQGIPIAQCHFVVPGLDSRPLGAARNDRLRAELGFADSDFVLLAPGESTRAADHRQSIWCAAILNVLDPRCRLLTWGRGPLVESLKRFSKRLRQDGLLVQASHDLRRPIDFEELTGVADAALIFASGTTATVPIGLCMAAGLSIISNVTSTLVEVLQDNRNALMVPRATPKTLAQRVLDLRHDPALQARIAQAARADAAQYFSRPTFLARHKLIYGQIAADREIEFSPRAREMIDGY